MKRGVNILEGSVLKREDAVRILSMDYSFRHQILIIIKLNLSVMTATV